MSTLATARPGGRGVGKGRPLDLTGLRVGRLVALRRIGPNRFGKILWECQCDCGRICEMIASRLQRGASRSCGCRMGFRGRPLADFFWYKVRKGPGCWEWIGHKDPNGYPAMTAIGHPELEAVAPGKRVWKGTRIAWFLEHGELPPPHLFVCHKCDNPGCVRPDHLFLGTARENNDDMVRKGRAFWQK